MNHLRAVTQPRTGAAGTFALGAAHIDSNEAALTPLCPLCGSHRNRKAFVENRCELRVCGTCDLFFIHPYPGSGERHREVNAGRVEGIELLDCARRYAGERLYYDRHFDSIAELCEGARSLLDVGCGTGHLLERFSSQREVHRVGIELNAEAARFARNTAECEIVETPFEEFHADSCFDAITMINVFSHLPSLDALFAAVRRTLNRGGKLIFRTSEMSADVSRWNQLHWGIPDDLHFLGLGTIEYLCWKYGFEIVHHTRLPYEEELFLPSRWKQMGRRKAVNALKAAGVRIPGALHTFQAIYRALLGGRLFVSLIAITPRSPRRARGQWSMDESNIVNA